MTKETKLQRRHARELKNAFRGEETPEWAMYAKVPSPREPNLCTEHMECVSGLDAECYYTKNYTTLEGDEA